jgi:hypothetical protein
MNVAPTGEHSVASNVAVLISESSRLAYAEAAVSCGEIYQFTDAHGRERHWLRNEWAYLAPNALSSILLRFNVKHDLVGEAELKDVLSQCHTLLIPNAGQLSTNSIPLILEWATDANNHLIVSGKTNLPPASLGLSSLSFERPDAYTGWYWTSHSPFCDESQWRPDYLTGFQGYTVGIAHADHESTVFARLIRYERSEHGVTSSEYQVLGDGIVWSPKRNTLYIANQVYEYLGGVFQAQLRVEDVRLRYNPTHWGDTIAYFVRELLMATGNQRLLDVRLRSFGTFDGVLQLRHDADHDADEQIDLSMLEYQVQNVVPASHYVMDPAYCGDDRCTVAGTKTWIDACARHNFIELATHNDSTQGDPPRNIIGKGLYEHIRASDMRFGLKSRTAGRHMGFHVHPETIDAMDYLYEMDPDFLGLCTFSLYDVIEYGDSNPAVDANGKRVSYITYDHDDPSRPAGISGYWFPYHVVLSTVDQHKVLRGWDVTHDTDCDFDRIDTLFEGRNAESGDDSSSLPFPVFTIQYEQQAANRATAGDGAGHLPYMRYAIEKAHRHNFWIATKRDLYQRMLDFEQIGFRVDSDGSVLIHNPTDHPIAGMVVEFPERSDLSGVIDSASQAVYSHVVGSSLVTLPILASRSSHRLSPVYGVANGPFVPQRSNSRLHIVECVRTSDTNGSILRVTGQMAKRAELLIEGLAPGEHQEVEITDYRGTVRQKVRVNGTGALTVVMHGPNDNFVDFCVQVPV